MKNKTTKVIFSIYLMVCWVSGLIFIVRMDIADVPWWGWVLIIIAIGVNFACWIQILKELRIGNEKHRID